MPPSHASIDALEDLVQRHRTGDTAARPQLIEYACDRFRALARRMLRDFARVRRWEDTDDVLQNALLRLWRALEDYQPESARHFLRLAAQEIRRELLDLSRHHFGPEGQAAHHESRDGSSGIPLAADRSDSTWDPARLARWHEFHVQIDRLPAEEREVFHLVFYQELTYTAAARLLGCSDNTARKRYLTASLLLQRALHGELPG